MTLAGRKPRSAPVRVLESKVSKLAARLNIPLGSRAEARKPMIRIFVPKVPASLVMDEKLNPRDPRGRSRTSLNSSTSHVQRQSFPAANLVQPLQHTFVPASNSSMPRIIHPLMQEPLQYFNFPPPPIPSKPVAEVRTSSTMPPPQRAPSAVPAVAANPSHDFKSLSADLNALQDPAMKESLTMKFKNVIESGLHWNVMYKKLLIENSQLRQSSEANCREIGAHKAHIDRMAQENANLVLQTSQMTSTIRQLQTCIGERDQRIDALAAGIEKLKIGKTLQQQQAEEEMKTRIEGFNRIVEFAMMLQNAQKGMEEQQQQLPEQNNAGEKEIKKELE